MGRAGPVCGKVGDSGPAGGQRDTRKLGPGPARVSGRRLQLRHGSCLRVEEPGSRLLQSGHQRILRSLPRPRRPAGTAGATAASGGARSSQEGCRHSRGTCAWPGARVSGLPTSMCSEWSPMPAGLPTGGAPTGRRSLGPQSPQGAPLQATGPFLRPSVLPGPGEALRPHSTREVGDKVISVTYQSLVHGLVLPSIHSSKKHNKPPACQAPRPALGMRSGDAQSRYTSAL